MARYGVSYSALMDVSAELTNIGTRMEASADELLSIVRGVRDNLTLDDLDYDELISRLEIQVRELSEDTTVAGGVVRDVHDAIRQVEDRVTELVSDAAQSGSNAVMSKGSSRADSGGPGASSDSGESSYSSGSWGSGGYGSKDVAGVAGAVGMTAGGVAASKGSAGSGGTADVGTSAGAASGAAGAGVGTAGTRGAGTGTSDAAAGSAGTDGFGGSAGTTGTIGGSSLSADGFGGTTGGGSDSAFQKLVDDVMATDGSTSPSSLLTGTMRGQMQDFAGRWAGFEQAALATQDASGSGILGFGNGVYERVASGFSQLVDMGGKGFTAFGSCVSVAVSRYGGGVAAVSTAVTFFATSVNGVLSFAPSSIAHAISLGSTSIADGVSPVSFARLLGR